VFFNFSWL